jgi:undecaprenyl-diphosphatase
MISQKTIIFCSILIIASLFLDKPVSILVSYLHTPILDLVMGWASNFVTVVFVCLIVSIALLYEENKKRFIPVLLLSFALSFLASSLLKFAFMRPRPEGLRFEKMFLVGPTVPDYAFPSSHASITFSVLPVVDKEFSKIQVFWTGFSVLVALSRIYLNQHYLSDVVFGSLLGYFIGYLVLKVEYRYGIIKGIFARV